MTADSVENDRQSCIVLINREGQYSLWSKDHSIPEGWTQVGSEGTRAECMEWIDKTWVDMRPLSLVHEMDGDSASR